MEFQQALQKVMQDQGWERKSLADALGVYPQSISNWTTGYRFPSAEQLIEIDKVTGIARLIFSSEDMWVPAPSRQMSWNDLLKYGMARNNYTDAQVSRALGVSRRSVTIWSTKQHMPSGDYFVALVRHLGIAHLVFPSLYDTEQPKIEFDLPGWIKYLRESQGLTKTELSKMLGSGGASTLSRWEHGRVKMGGRYLIEIDRILGVASHYYDLGKLPMELEIPGNTEMSFGQLVKYAASVHGLSAFEVIELADLPPQKYEKIERDEVMPDALQMLRLAGVLDIAHLVFPSVWLYRFGHPQESEPEESGENQVGSIKPEMELADIIGYLRKRAGMTTARLARKVGVTSTEVESWESGGEIPGEYLVALDQELGVVMAYYGDVSSLPMAVEPPQEIRQMTLGDVLRYGREKRGWTLARLAEESGTAKVSQISKYEQGKSFPRAEDLLRIAAILDVAHLVFPSVIDYRYGVG